jgi:hypothetical protein
MFTRYKVIFFIILALAALMFLASGLTGLDLGAGKPFPFRMGELSYPEQGPVIPGGEVVFNIFRVIYMIAWILFPILLLYILISPAARKMFLKQVARILPFVLALILMARYLQRLSGNMNLNPGLGQGNPPEFGAYPVPEPIFNPSAPPWAVWAASLGLALLIVGIIALVTWLVIRRRKKQEPVLHIAQEAQNALDEIQTGHDLRNVIIRCYFEMSDILNQTRGIQRGVDMTPHEFQKRLEENGLPREPVHQLTSLFEEVRYGQKPLGPPEEQRAITSLSAIASYCRGQA